MPRSALAIAGRRLGQVVSRTMPKGASAPRRREACRERLVRRRVERASARRVSPRATTRSRPMGRPSARAAVARCVTFQRSGRSFESDSSSQASGVATGAPARAPHGVGRDGRLGPRVASHVHEYPPLAVGLEELERQVVGVAIDEEVDATALANACVSSKPACCGLYRRP